MIHSIGRVCLLCTIAYLLNGCQETTLPYHALEFFSWKPDGTKIISVQTVDNHNASGKQTEIVTYNLQGIVLNRVSLSTSIDPRQFFERLNFTPDGKSFFAQKDEHLIIINSENGFMQTVASNKYFRASSPSGTLLLTILNPPTANLDSNTYAVGRVVNNFYSINNTWNTPSVYLNNIVTAIKFISDSEFVACTGPNGSCSLKLFDTSFHVLFSIPNQDLTDQIAFATDTKLLAYLSGPSYALTTCNVITKEIKTIKSLIHPISFDISSDGSKFIYSSNTKYGYGYYINYFDPNVLSILNLFTNIEDQLATDVNSSVQFSPDGKSIAYFSTGSNDVKLHILSVH